MSDAASKYLAYLENDYPSLEIIRNLGWVTAIVPDFPSEDAVHRFSEAAQSGKIVAISINGREIENHLVEPVRYETLMALLVAQSFATILLVIDNCLFCLKDSTNRFSIYFGERDRVSQICPSFPEMVDKEFLDWVATAAFNERETKYLMDKFDIYRAAHEE